MGWLFSWENTKYWALTFHLNLLIFYILNNIGDITVKDKA